MNNSMNILRRLMAFLLVLLLVTTMVGDDFYAIAEEDAVAVSEVGDEAAAAPAAESTGGEYTAEAAPVESSPAATEVAAETQPEPYAETPAEIPAETPVEIPTEAVETPAQLASAIGEEVVSEVTGSEQTETLAESEENQTETPNPETSENNEENNTSDNNQEVNNNANNSPVEEINNEEETNKPDENAELDTPVDNEPENTPDNSEEIAEPDEEDDLAIEEEEEGEEEEEEGEEEEEEGEEEEEVECDEHQWTYVSNGDGTHTKICAKCGETVTESCTMEDGVCIHCGYKEEEEAEECLHEEYEYISNGDGTHIKRCLSCGEETIEDCEFDAEGICVYCGYEEEEEGYKLVYTRISKTIDGVVITVKGDMPENATVDIQALSTEFAENFLENAGEGEYEIFRAYDINIYDADGNKYQPQTDGGTVEITVSGVSELNEVPDEEIEVLRVEHDNSVQELSADINGDEITFESEHFSYVFVGTATDTTEVTDYYGISADQTLSTTFTASDSKYHEVNSFTIYLYMNEGDTASLTGSVRSGLDSKSTPLTGSVVGSAITIEASGDDGDGWYTVTFDFSSQSDRWINPGEYYSINVYFGDDANVGYDISSAVSSTYYVDSESIDYSGMFVEDETTEQYPDDITAISLSSTGLSREIYSATGSAAIYTGEIYYLVGEEDTLTATLSPNYTRALTWDTGSSSVISLDSTSGSSVGITANTAGTATLTVTYSTGIYATLTIVVLLPYFGTSSYTTSSATSYSVEYAAVEYEPSVSFYNGSSSITPSSGNIGTYSYSGNKNAGTATITIPFTTANSITYSFTKTFTITQKALTWDDNFASAEFEIDTDANTVSSVTGADSGITDVDLEYSTDYTASLSGKTYTTSGIQYTVTISEGTSGNYSVSSVSGTYTVDTSANDINNYVEVHWVDDAAPSFEYTGSEISGLDWDTYFVFYYVDTTTAATFVTEDVTTVTYSNNTDVGTATISFVVSGYSGELTLTFEIYALTITNDANFVITITNEDGTDVSSGYASYVHTGSAITPDAYVNSSGDTEDHITVTYNSTTLTKGSDYTISYTGNTDIGTATVTVTGTGNFTGSKKAYFTIDASFTDDAVIQVYSSTYKAYSSNSWASGYAKNYTGSTVEPTVMVYLNGSLLSAQTSADSSTTGYYLTYADSINSDNSVASALTADAGTKYVVCVGTGNYAGEYIAASYTVKPINIGTNSLVAFTLINESFTYTGEAIELTANTDYTLTYTYSSTLTLTKDTDYTIAYTNNTDVGTASITITGAGTNYTGTKTSTFTITEATITADMLSLNLDTDSDGNYTTAYTGSAITPDVTVTFNSIVVSSSYYSVSYSDNTSVGTATVTVTGTGNFTGSAVVTFVISAKTITGVTVTLNGYDVTTDSYGNQYCTDYNPTYTGTVKKPTVVVKDGSTTLTKGTHYTLSWTNNLDVADYETYAEAGTESTNATYVTIVGKGNYSGTSLNVYFDIAPRSITASTVTTTITDPAWDDTTTLFVPTVEIVDNGTDLKSTLRGVALVEDTAYTVTGDSTATAAGAGYSVTIQGIGNYTGTIEDTYDVGTDISTLSSLTLSNPYDSTITYSKNSAGRYQAYYIGTEKHPSHKVVADSETLTEDTDFTAEYTSYTGCADTYNSYDDTNTVMVVLTGINGCFGTYTYYYDINPISVTESDGYVVYTNPENTFNLGYTGSTIDVTEDGNNFTITYSTISTDLVLDTDYTLDSTTIGPDIGAYTLTVTGQGNYTGTQTYKYNVVAGELSTIDINYSSSDDIYYDSDGDYYWVYYNQGSAITIDDYVVVKNVSATTLTQDTDYTLEYSNNSAVGTATITATGMGNYSTTSTLTITFKIVAIDVEDEFVVTINDAPYTYTGAEIQPTDITVTYNDTELTEGTDYEITGYGENIYPASAASKTNYVTVTGLGVYSGSTTAYFAIYLDLSDTSLVTVTLDNDSYTLGDDPVATVKYLKADGTTYATFTQSTTSSNTNYSVTYDSSTPGTGSVTITGLHDDTYNCGTGSKVVSSVKFVAELSSTYAYLSNTNFAYTGSDISIDDYLTVTYGEKDTDYTVTYNASDLAAVGTKTITVAATDDSAYFTGSVTLTYYVKYDLDSAVITLTGSALTYDEDEEAYIATYTGSAIAYTMTVYCPTTSGVNIYDTVGTYVSVTSTGLVDTGTHTITISNNNSSYVMGGPRNIQLIIEGIDISNYLVTLNATSFAYTGSEIKPTVTVTDDTATTTLTQNTDYTLAYSNNVNVSTNGAYVTVTGKGAYSGTLTAYFSITAAALSSCTVTIDTAYYAGAGVPVRPAVSITNGSLTLTEGTDYTLSYSSNEAGATAITETQGVVTITAGTSGNYTGTLTKTFDIEKLNLQSTSVSITPSTTEYTGEEIDPYDIIAVVLTNPYYDSSVSTDVETVTLTAEDDYTITVLDTTGVAATIKDMGTYTVKIAGANSCEQTVAMTFTVTTRSIPGNWINDTGDIRITVSDVETTGTTPTVAVYDYGVSGATEDTPVTLTENTDYTVAYYNYTTAAAGAYSTSTDTYGNYLPEDSSPYVVITGMGNYNSESVQVIFSVGKSLATLYEEGSLTYTKSGTYITEFTYNGASQIPTLDIKVTEDSTTTALVEDTDYTITVTDKTSGEEDSVNAGVKTLTITGKGSYYGSIADEYYIDYRVINGGITWTNAYTYEDGENNDDITFTLSDDNMTTLTATESMSIYGVSTYAGYYYEEYAGENVKPSITIVDSGLSEDAETTEIASTDYTITYVNNDAYYDPTTYGDYTYAYVTFTGNYTGSSTVIKAYFLIGQCDIEENSFTVQFEKEAELQLTDYTFDYTGTYIKPTVVVSNNSEEKLTEGTDYTVYYSDSLLDDTSTSSLAAATTPRDPGKAYVYVEGKGSYTGVLYRYFNIVALMSSTTFVTYADDGTTIESEGIATQFLTGSAITPDFGVILYRTDKTYITLVEDTDYTVAVTSDDGYTAEGTVIITAKSAYYSGTNTTTFDIELDTSLIKITNYDEEYEYTGYGIYPDFETNYDNITVSSVTYWKNGVEQDPIEVGDYVAIVTCTVESTSETVEKEADFAIVERSLSDCVVVYAKTQRYTGATISPAFTIYLKSTSIAGDAQIHSLVKNTDYTVDYGSYVSGTGVITLTGINNFKDTKLSSYTIALWPIVNLKKTASTQSSISVSWVRDSYSDGTELTLQKMNSSGTYVTVSTTKVKGTTSKYTFTGLDSSSSYQIKARAYTDGGIYSHKYVSVTATTEISTSSVTATSTSSGSATISWDDTGDVTVYYIYRDTNTNSTDDDTLVVAIPASTGTYTNANLTSGTTYYYYIDGFYLSNGSLIEVSKSDYVAVTVQ